VQLTLKGGFTFPVMFAVLAAAIVLAGLFYYRAYGSLRRGQWQLLLGLRIVAIVIVVLLLFRPVFSYQLTYQEKPALVVLIDTSASMSVADGVSGVPRIELARQQVERWYARLAEDFAVHLMQFSDRAMPLHDQSQLATLAANGRSTSLSTALQAAVQQVPKKELEAVILLSDGIHNTARSPLEVASKLGVVVHTVGVGASLRSNVSFRDVQVTGIDCPEQMPIHNKAKITGSVEAIGLRGRPVQVLLEEDGKQIQEAELTLDDVEGSQKVEFEIRPTVKGRHTYTVRVAPLADEKIAQNNQRTAVSMVTEPGIRVLYIEGTTRREYGAISSWFLAKDPDIEFCSMYQTRHNTFVARGNIADLVLKSIPSDEETIRKFDVFILGDLDSSFLRAEVQEMILRRVREGAGLLMIGGYHALGPGGYGGTPLGQAVPLRLGGREIGQITDPYLPQLTPEGVRHPIFANIDGFFPTRAAPPREAGLPELDGCTKVEGASPGATVLATNPLAGDMPVLAVQVLEKGRTAVFCGDTTWKWQQGPRALDQETPFLRYWGQMVRWLAGRSEAVEAKASISAATDKGFYDPEEPARITAVVRDDKGEGTTSATVMAKIQGPSNQLDEVPMVGAPGPGGHYAAAYVPKTAGKYEIVVEAKVGETVLASEKLPIEVGRVNLEFEKLDMDEKTLARIAADAKGRYVHVSVADSLIEQLDKQQRQKTEKKERKLYWPPGLWTLFVAVLTAEWILRRRFQLR
jgi:uncharacterized membrane protein